MYVVNAYRRNTRRYIDAFRDMDSNTFVATVKLTARRITEEGNGYDSGNRYVNHCRVPAGVNAKELARALEDTLGGSYCKHEYDCCGCPTYHVRAKVIAPRRICVHTRVTFNY